MTHDPDRPAPSQAPEVTFREMNPACRPGPERVDRRGGTALRGIFAERMMPTLHASTSAVGSRLRESSIEADPVLAGFRERVQAVSVGLKLIHRAVVEGTDLIVEGAHAVPGSLGLPHSEEAVGEDPGAIHGPWVHARFTADQGMPMVTTASLDSANPGDSAAAGARDAAAPTGRLSTTFGETSPTTRQE